MIFMTVGDQIPFDRLTRAVDAWAGRAGRHDIFAQIGESDYAAQHMETVVRLAPPEFEKRMQDAELVVGHAGTGTILKAMSLGKPILVMPRREKFRETRNDHQYATAKRFEERGVTIAWDENELADRLDRIYEIEEQAVIGPWASTELIDRLRRFIEE